MSSQKSVPALQIDLRPSRYLFLFILISHLGAITLSFFLPLAWWILLFVAMALLLSLRWYWRQHQQGFSALRWDGLDQWWLTKGMGDELLAELLPGSYVHTSLLVLRFRMQVQDQDQDQDKFRELTHSLVLLSDSADEDLLRRLRVRLKQHKAVMP